MQFQYTMCIVVDKNGWKIKLTAVAKFTTVSTIMFSYTYLVQKTQVFQQWTLHHSCFHHATYHAEHLVIN